jgi:GDP-D-mannose dehydratase
VVIGPSPAARQVDVLLGSAGKAREQLGWEPKVHA